MDRLGEHARLRVGDPRGSQIREKDCQLGAAKNNISNLLTSEMLVNTRHRINVSSPGWLLLIPIVELKWCSRIGSGLESNIPCERGWSLRIPSWKALWICPAVVSFMFGFMEASWWHSLLYFRIEGFMQNGHRNSLGAQESWIGIPCVRAMPVIWRQIVWGRVIDTCRTHDLSFETSFAWPAIHMITFAA